MVALFWPPTPYHAPTESPGDRGRPPHDGDTARVSRPRMAGNCDSRRADLLTPGQWPGRGGVGWSVACKKARAGGHGESSVAARSLLVARRLLLPGAFSFAMNCRREPVLVTSEPDFVAAVREADGFEVEALLAQTV